MDIAVENLVRQSDAELLATFHQVHRLHAERKFARDTERGRVDWLGARLFVTSKGGVTERRMALEASDDLAKKNQHIREMSLGLDLLKADVALISACLRLRGVASAMAPRHDEPGNSSATTGVDD
jgi:hypothetical protein